MEYLSFDPTSLSLTLKKGEIPVPTGDGILIKIAYSGVCGTDLHALDGSLPTRKEFGSFILGHEFSGIVQAVGPDATVLKVGQKVAVDPNRSCHKCDHCRSGLYQFCGFNGLSKLAGINRFGGWATHTVVPEDQVFVIPDDVDLSQAALSEPLSCLAHGWDKINPVHVGARVLVIGAGIIGLLWAALLHLHGLRKTVTVSEIQTKRLEFVKKLDMDYETLSPADLKGKQFDLAIDCSGSGPAMEAAVPLLGPGGRLCVFGVASAQATLTIKPLQIYEKELQVIGVNVNPYTFPNGLSLLRAMSDRYLNYETLGIGVYKLSEYKEALDALKKGDISKAVFKF